MYPFLAFGTTATNIEHVAIGVSKIEVILCNFRTTYTQAQNVLVIWQVFWREQAIEILEIAMERQLKIGNPEGGRPYYSKLSY